MRLQSPSFSNQVPVGVMSTAKTVYPYSGSRGFTPVSNFYRHINHLPFEVDTNTWRLKMHGLMKQPMSFSLAEMLKMPSVEMPCTLAAIISTPQNLLMGHALWSGIRFKQLLDRASPFNDAKYAQFTSVNGYVTYLPIKMLDQAILALAINGETLPVEQGYPARLIVPGVYDYKMPKWVQSVELVAAPVSGQYESRGWSTDGIVQTTSALFSPRMHEVVDGKVSFRGMAFAGTRIITKIEVSIDDGDWMPVSFVPAESGSWTCWQIDWQAPAPGDYLIKVRATDSHGFTQPDVTNSPIFPNGSSAIHAVVFRVSM